MTEYDVFKRLVNLIGAGWGSETNCPTLDDEGWSAEVQTRNAALFKRFRAEGFEHELVCALISSDSRATANDADTVQQFDVQLLLEERDSCRDASEEETPASPTLSNQRYRDGRKKAEEATTALAVDDAKASMASFMKTAEAYFLMKMQIMARDIDNREEDSS
ncbi:unnamed protein product [Phytophthora fragariaefolia]|uniref:Unnamed protein product n=1 Tax=Phytophthora fragariaefolia TaxID=1490495 RepID=A0A9W6WWS6_9STRA|nr:unnamed protein product [Phytophthora fragariaefolia]